MTEGFQGHAERDQRELMSADGILPEARSTTREDYIEQQVLWILPGHGQAYSDCGQKRYRGCLNVDGHHQEGLDIKIAGKAFLEWYLRSCSRLECPTCYEKAAALEAHKIEYRLAAVGRSFGRVIHLIVSPSKDQFGLTFKKLRCRAYKIAKQAGFRGGSVIFHPFRKHPRKGWYFSPHFHMLGYGWINWTLEDHNRFRWVVKNIGIRRSVAATAFYQISHCGLTTKKAQSFDARMYREVHSITWFGKMAYNKLRIAPEVQEKPKCPICGEELVPLFYIGKEELPGDSGNTWTDMENVVERQEVWSHG